MTTIKGIKRLFARPARLGLMAAAGLMAGGALAAGFDGKTLVTNDWFDASFTGLTVDTSIAQGGTIGITRGAGSWTAVPATGTAKIAADADAGGEATLLSIDVDTSDVLTFSPAPNAITSGYETVSVDFKTDPVYDLPDMDSGVQGAFMIYQDAENALSLQGYTANGWTNLVGATASDLTNVWLTLYTDYATVSNVRYVRYSVKLGDTLTILHDSSDTTWFPSAATSKMALESVSFIGSGKIRTFSGKELQEAVASNNGVNYGTLADAISAASAGDTITLSRTIYAETVNITKNLTINRNGVPLNADSFNIASGVTLTFTGASKQIKAPAFTGGGAIVATSSLRLCPTNVTATSTLASIDVTGDFSLDSGTAGNIVVTGNINVSGELSIAATAPTEAIVNAHPTYTTKLTANRVTAGTLTGGALIETTEGVFASNGTFCGNITGASGLSVGGTFTLQSTNTFSGNLTINSGTFAIGNIIDTLLASNKIRYNFDASDATTLNMVSESETEIASNAKGTKTYSASSNYATLSTGESQFGDTPVMYLNGSSIYSYSGSNDGGCCSYIYVLQQPESTDAMRLTYTWHSNKDDGFRQCDQILVSSGSWSTSTYGTSYNWAMFLDGGTSRTVTANKKSILSVVKRVPLGTSYKDTFGKTFTGYIAQALGFVDALSLEQRVAAETYLMGKWGLADKANFQFIPQTANVSLASGATLDLGGYDQTVASFTGGGTVQNGTLYTTSNVYTNNGALAIAAVDNMTVVLDAGATALTITGDAVGIKVTATEEFLASGSTITITATGLTGDNTIDFSEIPSNIFRFGVTDNEDGTWTVGAATGDYTAATYTWSPVNSSTDWTSLANWKVGEQAVAVLPQSVDTVVFPASEDPNFTGWTVALGENRTVNTVQFNANTTLSGGMFYVQGVSGGSGVVVTLGNSAGFANNGSNLTISLTMVVTAEEATPARFYSSDTNNSVNNKIILGADSKVTGSGYVKFNAGYDHYGSCVVEIRGDMTEFEGHVIVANGEGGSHRENTYMTSYGQSAYWTINNSSRADSRPNLFASQTYYFGSLTGSPGHYGDTTFTLEVGNLNQNDTLGGNYCRTLYAGHIASNGGTIRKVGTGTMTFSGSCVHAYEVNAGTLYIVSEKSLRTYWDSTSATRYTDTYSDEDHAYYPTITFGGENGGTLKLADAVDWDVSAQLRSDSQSVRFETDVARTWSTALDLSNTALVKSGSGTLTLSAAPLAEKFEISVEAGKVVVPNTVTNTKPAKGTKRTEVDGNYEYEKGDGVLATSETKEKTGLDGQAAADELAHTYNVTLTDAQVTQGLETSYYKVIATPTETVGTYIMSVDLDKDVVGVDMGKTDEGVDTPVTFTDTNPTFKLKNSVKKGLYYGVGTISNPTAENPSVTILAEQQATADGQAISLTPDPLGFGSGNVIYYKLSVSDTAQKNTP